MEKGEEIKGKCSFCAEFFTNSEMEKHLRSCEVRGGIVQRETAESLRRSPNDPVNRIYGIKVTAIDLPQYWLYLEMDGSANLGALDLFLRRVWVECCDHMSAFTIHQTEFEAAPFGSSRPGKKSMERPVFRLFEPGLEFHYEYDYGSTTDLDLKILWTREGPRHQSPVWVLSQNAAPVFSCVQCGKEGKHICQECWDGEETYCEKCLRKHSCGEAMVSYVVNSPRMGICGYTGPCEDGGSDKIDDEYLYDDDDEEEYHEKEVRETE